jgi:hypothetical protein
MATDYSITVSAKNPKNATNTRGYLGPSYLFHFKAELIATNEVEASNAYRDMQTRYPYPEFKLDLYCNRKTSRLIDVI